MAQSTALFTRKLQTRNVSGMPASLYRPHPDALRKTICSTSFRSIRSPGGLASRNGIDLSQLQRTSFERTILQAFKRFVPPFHPCGILVTKKQVLQNQAKSYQSRPRQLAAYTLWLGCTDDDGWKAVFGKHDENIKANFGPKSVPVPYISRWPS